MQPAPHPPQDEDQHLYAAHGLAEVLKQCRITVDPRNIEIDPAHRRIVVTAYIPEQARDGRWFQSQLNDLLMRHKYRLRHTLTRLPSEGAPSSHYVQMDFDHYVLDAEGRHQVEALPKGEYRNILAEQTSLFFPWDFPDVLNRLAAHGRSTALPDALRLPLSDTISRFMDGLEGKTGGDTPTDPAEPDAPPPPGGEPPSGDWRPRRNTPPPRGR